MKKCASCGGRFDLNMFAKEKRSKDGRHSYCRKCYNKYQRERWAMGKKNYDPVAKRAYDQIRKTDPIVIKRRIELQKLKYQSSIGRAKNILSNARMRAKTKRLEFTVSLEFVVSIIEVGFCQRSGLLFDLSNTKRNSNPFGPSLDRIDSKIGYTPENSQVVCSMYNFGKNEHDEIDFISMCIAVAEKNEITPQITERLKELRGE